MECKRAKGSSNEVIIAEYEHLQYQGPYMYVEFEKWVPKSYRSGHLFAGNSFHSVIVWSKQCLENRTTVKFLSSK